MASVLIRLIVDPVTGKKNVVISYESDADALPMEHEADHRRIVESLLAGGTLNAEELGVIVVDRGETPLASEEAKSEPQPIADALSEDA